jgi:hypothetical protein
MEIKGENVEVDLHARIKYISHTLIGDVLPGPREWGPTAGAYKRRANRSSLYTR